MTRKQERAIVRAIRDATGLRGVEVEAYLYREVGDVDEGCDAKVPLRDLDVAQGDRLDCYVYQVEYGLLELRGNVDVVLGDNLEPVAVWSTTELHRGLSWDGDQIPPKPWMAGRA